MTACGLCQRFTVQGTAAGLWKNPWTPGYKVHAQSTTGAGLVYGVSMAISTVNTASTCRRVPAGWGTECSGGGAGFHSGQSVDEVVGIQHSLVLAVVLQQLVPWGVALQKVLVAWKPQSANRGLMFHVVWLCRGYLSTGNHNQQTDRVNS